MYRIEITIDDEFSLDDLLKSSIPGVLDDNQLFGDAFFQNAEVSSSSRNVSPNQAYCPSLNTKKEEQQMKVGDLKGYFGDITQNLSMDEPRQHEQIRGMTTATNVIVGNNDQLNNKYNTYTMDDLFEFAEALSPDHQQNGQNSIYNDKEQFLQPMPPTILKGHRNINTCMVRLSQGGMDLSACYGAQGKQLLSDGILPMPTPTLNLMPMMMSIPILKTNSQNNNTRLYNMHDTFHPYGHKPTNLQVLQNMHLQQQQLNNNSSHVLCCGATTLVPDISTPQTSTHKSGRISAHERNVKIESYLYKRKRRNFSKKIKYACRKTLADSRPRVRGRFAKNNKTEQMARSCSTNSNEL